MLYESITGKVGSLQYHHERQSKDRDKDEPQQRRGYDNDSP